MITKIDFKILDWIASHIRCDFLDSFFPSLTALGDGGLIWIALAIILLLPKRTRSLGLSMGISIVMGTIICNMTLKPLTARVRSFNVNTAAQVLIPKPNGYSFPSGHTTSSFAAATSLLFSRKRGAFAGGVCALIPAVLIAFSRLYIYVHYPSDVIAGMALGTFCGFISNVIVRKFI
jgi:undecaprenyl-diphosphatase